jgi:hypothetical protein
MNVQEAMLIFNCIERAGNNGSGLIKLSQETRLDVPRLQEYLKEYPEYFLSIEGSPNFQITKHGEYAGNTNLMLDALTIENKNKSKRKMLSSSIIFLGALVAIVSSISQIEAVQMLFSLLVSS